MICIDVSRVKGKIAENNLNLTVLSKKLGISRNTLSLYLKYPSKIPYKIMAEMAEILCVSKEEAASIFFANNLRLTKVNRTKKN